VTESAQIALLVIMALLVGALVPLLISASATLRQARETLRVLETRAVEVGDKTSRVLERADRIAAGLEQELPALHRTSDRLDQLGTQVEQLTDTVRKVQAVSATVGPAMAAGFQAYRAVCAARTEQASAEQDAEGNQELPQAVSDAILAQVKKDATEASDAPSDPA
jgi:uncharacterized protein YoxC